MSLVDRDYGQTEFFVTDDDGYSHCFGVATNKSYRRRGPVLRPLCRKQVVAFSPERKRTQEQPD